MQEENITIKELALSKALDPYHKKENGIVEYLVTPYTIMKEFFDYMQSNGYALYNKVDYLRKIIMSYSTKLKNAIKDEDEKLVDGRNYNVAPKLTDEAIMNLVWKWQGNVMEIIAGNMFIQKCHPFTNKYMFDQWVGNDITDAGVDGWLRHNVGGNSSNFFIGVQVKYRFEKNIKWNDQITKALALTDERMRELYSNNVISDSEWCYWGKQIKRRALIVTTTKISDTITKNIGTNAYDKIDEDDLLEYLGCMKNINGNKLFWEKTYNSIN